MDDLDLDSTFVVIADPDGLAEPVAVFADGSYTLGWMPRSAHL